MTTLLRRLALLVMLAASLAAVPAGAATITIINNDAAGTGFNDPTPATPVGGNTGTTLGAQRLIVFQTAAAIWGGILPSTVEIRVGSQFTPLSCTASSAVLGSCGTTTVHRDFPGAEWPGTWYHQPLANKESGVDQAPANDDMTARFNSNLGITGCLTGITWYYGLDHNESASQIDLLAVVLHEMSHGLGFSTLVNSSGTQLQNLPDVYDRFLVDNSTGKRWTAMSDAERAASAINTLNVIWDGRAAAFMAPLTLAARPVMNVTAPAGIAGQYAIGTAAFGAPLTTTPVAGALVLADDGAAPTSDACTGLVNGGAIAGNIALIDRGTCGFTVKAKNAQNAGAIAAIIVDNVVSSTPPGLGGADPTVTIPTVSVTQAVGATLKANLAAGVEVSIGLDPTLKAGADPQGRPYVYTPNPYQSGSSVSHWDVSATPNLLMEPAINADLTSNVDLTRYVFEDEGWLPRTTSVGPGIAVAAQLAPGAPNPFSAATTIRFTLVAATRADLSVYDLNGRRVKRLVAGTIEAGEHAVTWDGTDQSGRALPSGVYLYRLTAGAAAEAHHIVLFR